MSRKILIVDDDPNFLDLMRAEFLKNGWQVSLATNGSDALEKFAVFMPDVLTLDVLMPGLDGFKTIDLIRKYIKGHDYLLFFLTYFDDSDVVLESIKTYHPADYLDKATFQNDVNLIYWSIDKKYNLLKKNRMAENNGWVKLDPENVKAFISIKIYSGFSGIVKIKCAEDGGLFKFQHGIPVLVELNGKVFNDVEQAIEAIGDMENCRIREIGESEVKDMLKRRLGLMFESIVTMLNIPLNIAVVDTQNHWVISNFPQMESMNEMPGFVSVAGSILSRLTDMLYANADHIVYRTDRYAVIVIPLTDGDYLVVVMDIDRFDSIRSFLMALLRSKIPGFRRILERKAVT